MTIKIGSVYNVTFKSGNTHTAFSWPSKIPDSGNGYMKNKVIKITKKLNPKDTLDYDYVGDIYDKNDDAVELKNIKIVSNQLLLKSSTLKVAGSKKRKKSKSRTKKKSKKRTKKRTKKRNKNKSSRKIRKSSRKTRKRKMKGGSQQSFAPYDVNDATVETTDDGRITYSFELFINNSDTDYGTKIGVIKYTYSGFESLMKILEKQYRELMHGIRSSFPRKTLGDGKSENTQRKRKIGLKQFLNNLLSKDNELRYFILSNFAEPDHPLFESTFELGRGSFGVVYQVRKIGDNKNYAMKTIHKDRSAPTKDLIIDERNFLETITRNYVPYVVRMYCSFQTLEYCCMVLNLGVMDMRALIEDNSLDFKCAQFIAAEIVLALEGLHNLNIVHRDLKPENIMIDNSGHIFLTDFGLSKEVEATDGETKGITDSYSTLLYSAPEMFGETLNYGKAVDWWALGIIIYEMLTPNGLKLSHPCYGPIPVDDKGVQYTMDEIEEETFMDIISKTKSVDLSELGFTDDTFKLLSGLLMVNPDQRLTDPSRIKVFPFFEGVQWEELLKRESAVAAAEISGIALREANKAKVKIELSGDTPDPLVEEIIKRDKEVGQELRRIEGSAAATSPIFLEVKILQSLRGEPSMDSSTQGSLIFTHDPVAAAEELNGWNYFKYFASPEMGGLYEYVHEGEKVEGSEGNPDNAKKSSEETGRSSTTPDASSTDYLGSSSLPEAAA